MQAPRAALVAFLLGLAMMALELTAVRLMAPYFGDSAYVWTNVIGVMLVALAAGAWIGGIWAGRPGALRRLMFALLVASVLAAVVPLVAGSFGAWLVPQDVPLEAAMAALVRGSLVATLVLFSPPVLLLGCASPMLVAALVESGARVGRASGLVNACSTVGSLAGTFLATHLLLPSLGSRISVWLCAAAVAVCAALVGRRVVPLAGAALALVLAVLVRGPLRAPPAGQVLLAERESAYQYLQVVRDTTSEPPATALKINEGLDSFHSLALEGTAWTNGAYYDWHVTAPVLAADGHVPAGEDLRVLSLGAAAGTFARLFASAFPGCRVDGVEIDPEVVALGELFFGGRHAAGEIHAGLDARVFVGRAPAEAYDVVLVDTYERQIYVPAHMASVEFFRRAERCLRPGGVVSVNSGGWSVDDPVVRALGATMTAVFGEAWAFRVPWSRNWVLAARKGRPLDPSVLARAETASPELGRVLARAGGAGAWQRLAAEGPVLTDDRPLLDDLQHEAMHAALTPSDVVPTAMNGTEDPDVVGDAARALLLEDRADAVLAAVGKARTPTPFLRLLAGDARWALHDVAGARAEFTTALAALPAEGPEATGDLARALADRATRAGAWLARVRRGAAAGTRNAWLVAVGAAAFVAVFLVLGRRGRAARAAA